MIRARSRSVVGFGFNLVALLALFGCGGSSHNGSNAPTGTATTLVTILIETTAPVATLAPLPAAITTITIEVSAADIQPPITRTVNVIAGEPVSITLEVPPGPERTFTAKGYDNTSTLRYSGQFTTAIPAGPAVTITLPVAVVDSTPPAVLFVHPQDGLNNQSPQTTPSANFSEAIDPATLNTTTVVMTAGADAIEGSVAYNATDRSVTFTPTAALALGTEYTVTLTIAITDLAGNGLAAPFVFHFTTSPAPPIDLTPPTAVVDPTDGAHDIPLSILPSAQFSEAMAAATVTSGNIFVTTGTSAIIGSVTYNPTTFRATFTPLQPLALNTTYSLTLTTGLTDLAGNPLPAPVVAQFTTTPGTGIDITFPPVIIAVNPGNDAVGVSASAAVTATFNTAINPATVTSATFQLQSQAGFVAGTVGYDAPTQTASFIPTQPLAPNTRYVATVTRAVTDTDAVPTPMGQDYTWRFTTGSSDAPLPSPP